MEIKFQPNRLTIARTARGYNMTQLGDKFGYKKGNHISQIELGKRLPTLELFEKFCEVLEVSPNFLMGLSDYSELNHKKEKQLAEQLRATLAIQDQFIKNMVLDK